MAGPAGGMPHPAVLATLQRTAGNAAVAHWVQRQEESEAREEARQNAAQPTQHPEWSAFCAAMKEKGISDGDADIIWQLVLGGIAEQGPLNDEAMGRTGRQEQRDHRATNTWFQELGKFAKAYLAIDKPALALWSGGKEASDYAEKKGHSPLESTRIGSVIHSLSLTSVWTLKTPMWNVLSKEFVQQAADHPVHIFLRVHDPESVLALQEVPQLKLIRSLFPTKWHPLYETGEGMREIGKDLTLVDDAAYDTQEECVRILSTYLRYHHDPANEKSERAAAKMRELAAAEGEG
ncbi:hypothetical protein [Streptomyces sp. NPDC048659]|uniref:hypothetical protein n=1 Tax=Streptomyces sp. NPDC048659 TaxID=3155489 RepID=UPI0034428A99